MSVDGSAGLVVSTAVVGAGRGWDGTNGAVVDGASVGSDDGSTLGSVGVGVGVDDDSAGDSAIGPVRMHSVVMAVTRRRDRVALRRLRL